ncbi:MAG TPA: dihydrofolate reductase family protein [Chloroflexota bacterium]|nr:dihydrofolate reductase family protein [Chloroflexota bacterium]
MTTLSPLQTLFDAGRGNLVPLPAELADLYGELRLAMPTGRPAILANFVETLDGVVSLAVPGQAGGSAISGSNAHDRMVMGILRAVADAVVVGAGTLRSVPLHLWTAEYVYPPLAPAYGSLRAALGKSEPPLNVIVSARGDLNLDWRVFRSGEVSSIIVTTAEGAERIRQHPVPPSVQIDVARASGKVPASRVLAAIERVRPGRIILVEGGPYLLGDFLAEALLDTLFLTLAPQIAGRDNNVERPALVEGRVFAPDHPLWTSLSSVKRAESHLFLRYALTG